MKTVSILDDDQALVELFETFLGEEGYNVKQVVFSKDLPVVLENIKATAPDMLVLDVHLPGLGSFEIMQGMKADATLAGLPILVASASRPSLVILRQLMEGAGLVMPRVLEKPFELDDLIEAIQTLLGDISAQ